MTHSTATTRDVSNYKDTFDLLYSTWTRYVPWSILFFVAHVSGVVSPLPRHVQRGGSID
jgi:hypothetical protein